MEHTQSYAISTRYGMDEHSNQILIEDLRQPDKVKGCSTVERIARTRSDNFLLVQPAFWWDNLY
jgi:hypothetical protein